MLGGIVVFESRIITDTLFSVHLILGNVVNIMTDYEATETLDVKGENCPMPVVKTKQNIDTLADGEILKVLATDPGSMSDIDGWAATTDGVELLDQQEGDDVFKHYVRKSE